MKTRLNQAIFLTGKMKRVLEYIIGKEFIYVYIKRLSKEIYKLYTKVTKRVILTMNI